MRLIKEDAHLKGSSLEGGINRGRCIEGRAEV